MFFDYKVEKSDHQDRNVFKVRLQSYQKLAKLPFRHFMQSLIHE